MSWRALDKSRFMTTAAARLTSRIAGGTRQVDDWARGGHTNKRTDRLHERDWTARAARSFRSAAPRRATWLASQTSGRPLLSSALNATENNAREQGKLNDEEFPDDNALSLSLSLSVSLLDRRKHSKTAELVAGVCRMRSIRRQWHRER